MEERSKIRKAEKLLGVRAEQTWGERVSSRLDLQHDATHVDDDFGRIIFCSCVEFVVFFSGFEDLGYRSFAFYQLHSFALANLGIWTASFHLPACRNSADNLPNETLVVSAWESGISEKISDFLAERK